MLCSDTKLKQPIIFVLRDAAGNRVVGGYESNSTIMTARLISSNTAAESANTADTDAMNATNNGTADSANNSTDSASSNSTTIPTATLSGASATSSNGFIIFNNLRLKGPAGEYKVEFIPTLPDASLNGARLIKKEQSFVITIKVILIP